MYYEISVRDQSNTLSKKLDLYFILFHVANSFAGLKI